MDFIGGLLERLADTPLSHLIHESDVGFPAVESAHVVAITLVLGSIMIVDLRLLGLASTKTAVTALTAEILPWTWGFFILAVVTGALMFISQPVDYFGNTAFRVKMLLLVVAGLNMLAFHAVAWRGVAAWDRDPKPPARARLAGGISLVCWLAVIAAGRVIGFTMFPG